MSLRWRIALGLGLIAASVSAFGAVASYLSTQRRLERTVDESLLALGTSLHDPTIHGDGGTDGRTGNPTTDPTGNFSHPDACPPAGLFESAVAAQRIAADGTTTSCIEGGIVLQVDAVDRALARNGGSSRLRTISSGGHRYRVATIVTSDGSVYQVARSLREVDSVLSSLQWRLAVIGGSGVAAAVLLGLLIARRTVKPVDRLRDAAEHIARTQDLDIPISAEGPAEIGSLARSFTTMVDALAQSRQDQQQLVRDASHELRTPLTSLRTNAELLARAKELEPEQYRTVVERLQFEIGELSDLVTELVELATDPAGRAEAVEPVDLGELARSVATRARRRTDREIVVEESGDPAAPGRPAALERVVSNLVDNALKYSPAGTPIVIAVDGRRVEVRDEGPGIPPEDLPRVFDRFYRSVAARTAPGSGLGLAIVKQTVESHGGAVWAVNRPTGGAAVGFELPAGPEA